MSGRIAYPFLTLPPEAVEARPWLIALDGGPETPAEEHLADWDYAATVRVRRQVQLDLRRASEALDISQETLSLEVLVGVGTGAAPAAARRALARPWPIKDAPNEPISVEAAIPGERLSAALHLETMIILAKPPTRHGPLSPRLRGARLWSDRKRIRLEGDEARFALEAVSFSRLFGADAPHAGALWYLDWRPGDWGRSFAGSVRLLLNADHPGFIERITGQDPLTLQSVLGDVMLQIAERALADEEVAEALAIMEEESVGGHVAAWLDRIWPGRTAAEVRRMLEGHPSQIRAALQSAAMMEPER